MGSNESGLTWRDVSGILDNHETEFFKAFDLLGIMYGASKSVDLSDVFKRVFEFGNGSSYTKTETRRSRHRHLQIRPPRWLSAILPRISSRSDDFPSERVISYHTAGSNFENQVICLLAKAQLVRIVESRASSSEIRPYERPQVPCTRVPASTDSARRCPFREERPPPQESRFRTAGGPGGKYVSGSPPCFD